MRGLGAVRHHVVLLPAVKKCDAPWVSLRLRDHSLPAVGGRQGTHHECRGFGTYFKRHARKPLLSGEVADGGGELRNFARQVIFTDENVVRARSGLGQDCGSSPAEGAVIDVQAIARRIQVLRQGADGERWRGLRGCRNKRDQERCKGQTAAQGSSVSIDIEAAQSYISSSTNFFATSGAMCRSRPMSGPASRTGSVCSSVGTSVSS